MQTVYFMSLQRDTYSQYEAAEAYKSLIPQGCTKEWLIIHPITDNTRISFVMDMAKRVLRDNEELHVQRLRGREINEKIGRFDLVGAAAGREHLIITAVGKKKPKKGS